MVDQSTSEPLALVVMGVQGSGKSTIGRLLAERLGAAFIDGDDLHTPAAKAKMASGAPLDDDDRRPWLQLIAAKMAESVEAGAPIVVACSALKRSYRDLMRERVPSLGFAHLDGDKHLIAQRLTQRDHEYMPPTLLDSQFQTLEPLGDDESGTTISLVRSPDEIVDALAESFGGR
ncbi:gluconokinase [Ruicaihuangia caeni]|uniref:gluconokinase n=1 Tax=Ruicaihuangia caeni TaxID=3042517 RepID=UPI00338F7756